MRIHVVSRGSVYSIARLYDVPMQRIISDNELPADGRLIRVRRWSSLGNQAVYRQARRFGLQNRKAL